MSARADPLRDASALVPRVYAYVAYRIGHGAEAEDVTADVFERALRHRASYDPARGEPAAWLFGIARRRLASRTAPEAVPLDDELAADEESVEERTVRSLELRRAIATLPPRDRELVALRYGADMTSNQIGAVLGLRRNAVDVALHRALTRLRVELGDGRRRRENHGGPTRSASAHLDHLRVVRGPREV